MSKKLPTLGDVRKLIASVHLDRALFGCTEEVGKEFATRARTVGTAICEDRSIVAEEATKLPDYTILGTKASQELNALEKWVGAVFGTKK